MNFVTKNDEFYNNLNYDMKNLSEFLTAFTMGMNKIIDNVVPTERAKGKYANHCTIIFEISKNKSA